MGFSADRTGLYSETGPGAPASCVSSPLTLADRQLTPSEHHISAEAGPEDICRLDLVVESWIAMGKDQLPFYREQEGDGIPGTVSSYSVTLRKGSGMSILSIPDSAATSVSLLIPGSSVSAN